MTALFLTLIALLAQWPTYKHADAPRLPDGKVNLAAPAPKVLDGHPDLSGVWENPGWREGAQAASAAGIITGVGGAPTTRSEPARRGPAPMIAAFFELGSMVPGGLPYQPWARELKDKRTREKVDRPQPTWPNPSSISGMGMRLGAGASRDIIRAASIHASTFAQRMRCG